MEPFAIKIRISPTFKGLNIPGYSQEARISQYADDITLICTDLQSITESLSYCQFWESFWG